MTVEKADNCAVLAKTTDGLKRFSNSKANSAKTAGFEKETNAQDDLFKIGKTIVISTGPLKGYRGVIKSINRERI
jgi:transcription elongation factor